MKVSKSGSSMMNLTIFVKNTKSIINSFLKLNLGDFNCLNVVVKDLKVPSKTDDKINLV